MHSTQEPSEQPPRTVASRLALLEREVARLRVRDHSTAASVTPTGAASSLNVFLFSNDLDRVLSALTLATTSAAMGVPSRIFFAFWGASALRRVETRRPRSPFERLIGWMLPRGSSNLKMSQMHFGGAGTAVMKRRMRAQNLTSCDDLFGMARELRVEFRVCEMSLSLLGMTLEDLVDYPGLEPCGAATFLELSGNGQTLFI